MKNEYRNSLRSKELIKQAFIELLRDKPIIKITVTDIIQKANISRGTFYTHYKDTYDLIEHYKKEFTNQLSKLMLNYAHLSLYKRFDALIDIAVDMLKQNIELYQIIAHQEFPFSFYSDIKNAFITELLHEQNIDKHITYALNICISGFIMFIKEWLENPQFDKLEEAKNVLSQLIRQVDVF